MVSYSAMADPQLIDRSSLRRALATATEALLAERNAEGHWTGELSSSALSTATASFALNLADPSGSADLVRRGLRWLVDHRNADGGWGDTTISRSNLSTTVLCWSALAAAGDDGASQPAIAAAERYIAGQCGSLDPAAIARAVAGRYGQDRTFSAPILTMCALAGRLGPRQEAWRHVSQLPFELAACPHALLKALRLPVVSYALPALVAIGQVRHRFRPSRNVLARCLRATTARPTMRLLAEIQPTGGGFLEAPPLTSFVLMSLAAMGQGTATATAAGSDARDSVIRRAASFLRGAARGDGSWPIDTNLATWLTTLAVQALPPEALEESARGAIRDWLLGQQHIRKHPYTRAEPGGWAWTDLPGGVPDADDTAGALRALRLLGPPDERTELAAAAGCWWLLRLQNADGGVPTFCRGWGRMPFDRSSQDLTAHALLAWSAWQADLPVPLAGQVRLARRRAMDFLLRRQGADGSWTPLWFGNEDAADEANPVYGTSRVLLALAALAGGLGGGGAAAGDLIEPIRRGAAFLLAAQGEGGGWGGGPGVPPSVEETALATDALAAVAACPAAGNLAAEDLRRAAAAGAAWLVEHTRAGRQFPPAPIGLYFARLWYHERLYPILFTVSALRRAARTLGA